MYGAILGDIAGSTYEFVGNKNPEVDLFPLGSGFTDDSMPAQAIGLGIRRKECSPNGATLD
jgi:ADP-ribosyl-[dinitrogen reductase] hydrolase